jgi:hypothetical protein
MRRLLILALLCVPLFAQRAVDSQGRVTTGNTSIDTIIGPMLADGTSSWTWYDNRHKAAAAVQIADLAATYLSSDVAYFDVAAAGTITVVNASKTVTGSGTAFTTLFCQGPGSPTVVKTGTPGIIVWYTYTYGGETVTGRRQVRVESCTDDTHLTIVEPWTNVVVGSGSGFSYSYMDDTVAGNWIYGPAPQNYYDNVLALYAVYWRTGTASYLTAARKLASLWWRHPNIDRGNNAAFLDSWTVFPARSMSLLGLILYALDGHSEMWPGLRKWRDYYLTYLAGYDVTGGIWDLREIAYHQWFVAAFGIADPDAGEKATAQAAVAAALDDVWTGTQIADGSWPQLYGTPGGALKTVTVTNGSNEVAGSGTSWTSAINAGPIWFTTTSATPTSNASGDAVAYIPTYVSGTSLTLDRVYEGTNGSTKGYVLASVSGEAAAVGFGVQPFMMSITGSAFEATRAALATADPTNAAIAAEFRDDAVTWVRTNGYWSAVKGLYYFAGFPNCASVANSCDTSETGVATDTPGAARVLNAEVLRPASASYLSSGDATLKTWADTLFSAMWSNDAEEPGYDGHYIDSMDDDGWYLTGDPATHYHPKWFGQFFGVGGGYTWPAARLGEAEAGSGGTVVSGSVAQAGAITILP